MVYYCRNVNFEEMDTEHSTGKNDRMMNVNYCEGYLRTISNKIW